jgi:hypothetical protein
MNERRILNDVVILAQGVPQTDKHGKTTICTIGYSMADNEYLRIYPTHPSYGLRRWDRVQMDCERHKADWRFESWQLRNGADDLSIRIRSTTRGKLTRPMRQKLISRIADLSIDEINESKRSIGIVRAVNPRVYLKQNKQNFGFLQQTSLAKNESPYSVRADFSSIPYVKFVCWDSEPCSGHDMQLQEWGVYEYMRKNPTSFDSVLKNLQMHNYEWTHFLVVGNQVAHPNSFMVIGDIRFKHYAVQMEIFES